MKKLDKIKEAKSNYQHNLDHDMLEEVIFAVVVAGITMFLAWRYIQHL